METFALKVRGPPLPSGQCARQPGEAPGPAQGGPRGSYPPMRVLPRAASAPRLSPPSAPRLLPPSAPRPASAPPRGQEEGASAGRGRGGAGRKRPHLSCPPTGPAHDGGGVRRERAGRGPPSGRRQQTGIRHHNAVLRVTTGHVGASEGYSSYRHRRSQEVTSQALTGSRPWSKG